MVGLTVVVGFDRCCRRLCRGRRGFQGRRGLLCGGWGSRSECEPGALPQFCPVGKGGPGNHGVVAHGELPQGRSIRFEVERRLGIGVGELIVDVPVDLGYVLLWEEHVSGCRHVGLVQLRPGAAVSLAAQQHLKGLVRLRRGGRGWRRCRRGRDGRWRRCGGGWRDGRCRRRRGRGNGGRRSGGGDGIEQLVGRQRHHVDVLYGPAAHGVTGAVVVTLEEDLGSPLGHGDLVGEQVGHQFAVVVFGAPAERLPTCCRRRTPASGRSGGVGRCPSCSR